MLRFVKIIFLLTNILAQGVRIRILLPGTDSVEKHGWPASRFVEKDARSLSVRKFVNATIRKRDVWVARNITTV